MTTPLIKFFKTLFVPKNSVTLDLKFFIFLLCNALASAYRHSDLISFFKGFLYAFLVGFVVYYFCALISKKPLRLLLEWLFITSGIVFSVTEIFTLLIFGMPFSKDLFDSLFATNHNETIEFIQNYKTYLCYYLFILIVLFVAIKIIRFGVLVPCFLASVLGLTILTIESVRNVKYLTDALNENILKGSLRYISLTRGSYYALLSSLKRSDARKIYTSLKNNNLPSHYLSSLNGIKNIILIIGESASKNFMQLYGYNAPNNPLLSTLANERERERE